MIHLAITGDELQGIRARIHGATIRATVAEVESSSIFDVKRNIFHRVTPSKNLVVARKVVPCVRASDLATGRNGWRSFGSQP